MISTIASIPEHWVCSLARMPLFTESPSSAHRISSYLLPLGSSGAGFEQIGLTPPEGRNDITGHLTDIISYNVGGHQFRFGGEFRQARVNEFYHRRGTGKFTFDGTQGPWAGDTNVDPTTKALADFLAGDVSSSTIAVGNPERFVRVNAFNLYLQDAWQLTRKLNV